jgi:hypothetical protein
MLQESDFHGRFVHPETGLEYENFGACFQGEPEKTIRNYVIQVYREQGCREPQLRAYWQAFDSAKERLGLKNFDSYGPGSVACHREATAAFRAAGGIATVLRNAGPRANFATR